MPTAILRLKARLLYPINNHCRLDEVYQHVREVRKPTIVLTTTWGDIFPAGTTRATISPTWP